MNEFLLGVICSTFILLLIFLYKLYTALKSLEFAVKKMEDTVGSLKCESKEVWHMTCSVSSNIVRIHEMLKNSK